MKTAKMLPVLLLGLLSTGCVVTPVGQVTADTGYGDTRVRMEVSNYPDLALVPGSPVYYAPGVNENYFFYDGMYWVFQGDNWYASYWFNGPWSFVRIDLVPLYILRVPVYYYRRPPPYFQPWRRDQPPRWGERWGHDWEDRHPGWMRTEGAMPPPAPRPEYQRNYSGRRYPAVDEQARLRQQYYRYEAREPVDVRPGVRAPANWQQQQEQWQQRRQDQQEQDRRQRMDQPGQVPGRDDRGQPGPGRDDRGPWRDDQGGRPQWRYEQDSPQGGQGNVRGQGDAQRPEQDDRWRQRQQDMDPRFQQGQMRGQVEPQSQAQGQGQGQGQPQGQRQWRGEWRQQPVAPDARDQGGMTPRPVDNAPNAGWSTYRQDAVPVNPRANQPQFRQDSDGGWSSQAPEPRNPRTHVRGAPGNDSQQRAPQWRRTDVPASAPQQAPYDVPRGQVPVQDRVQVQQPAPQAGGVAPRGRRGESDRRSAPQGQGDGQSGSQGSPGGPGSQSGQGNPGNPGSQGGIRDGGR